MHTPGEWKVDTKTGEVEAWMPNMQGPVIIGTIYGADDFPCCEEDITEECKSNAALIAAAPDLLEACKAAKTELKQLFKIAAMYGMDAPFYPVLDQIRAAIKKAEESEDV